MVRKILKKSFNFRSLLEKSLQENYLIFLLSLEKSMKFTPSFTLYHLSDK